MVVRAVAKQRSQPSPRGAPRAANRAVVGPPTVAHIVETLRGRIARQDIAPGTKLRETEISEEFGASRARVREALGALEQRRLVERIPNRGALVTRLDPVQALQIYDLREVLEALCARLATVNGDRALWKRELALFRGPMKELVERNDLDPYIERYEALRREIIEAAGNPIAAEMLDTIYEKTQVLIRRILILPGRAEAGRLLHVAMLEAMVAGDAEEAERLRREGLRNAKACLQKFQKYIL